MFDDLGPEELGRDLRRGSGPFLQRRRGVIKLALLSCGALGVTALYQTGILKKLPGPRSRFFDAEKVNGSAQAYSILAMPDALLGLVSYAVTACLAAGGSEERWKKHPVVPLAMGMKVLGDAAFAGKLTVDEGRKFHAFSLWSLVVTGATVAAVPLALPEAKAAFDQLTAQRFLLKK